MIDKAQLAEISQRFSLPPPLVYALSGQTPPDGLLVGYGVDPKIAKADPMVMLTLLAHSVAQSFAKYNDIQSALSEVFAGDPQAHTSQTSHIGGLVDGILGRAAVNLHDGWENYAPASQHAFAGVAHSMTSFLRDTRDQGGIVGDDALHAWDHAVARIAPPTKASAPVSHGTPAVDNRAPTPKGPSSGEVEQFASDMKGLGIDVDHFLKHFPTVSSLRYKLLSAPTTLQNYAAVKDMNSSEMLSHIREEPHPVYNHLTAGAYADAHDLATLHAVPNTGRLPLPAEVSKFASTGANWKDVSEFYQRHGNA